MGSTVVTGENNYTTWGIEPGIGYSDTHGATSVFGVQVGTSSVSADAVVKDDGSLSAISLPSIESLEISYKRILSRDDKTNKSNRISLGTAQDGRLLTLPIGLYAEWGEASGDRAGGFGGTIGPRLMSRVDRLETNVPTLQLGAEVLAQIGTRKINGDFTGDMGVIAGIRLSVGSAENSVSF